MTASDKRLTSMLNAVLNGDDITKEDAIYILTLPDEKMDELLYASNLIRTKFFNDKIDLCSIINAKSGMCSENCAFCSQSIVSKAKIDRYPLLKPDAIISAAKDAFNNYASHFCIVTSGKSPTDYEIEKICDIAQEIIKKIGIPVDVSLGIATYNQIKRLSNSGIKHYNHNLETSPGYFNNLCSTHSFTDRIETVKRIKASGINTCSGGIFGIGENEKDRVELAFILKELDVDFIPLNFLHPIEGTPLGNMNKLTPEESLKVIAMFRFVNPTKTIRICGGRELVLKDKQILMFSAGANATMIGNYLTTKGNPPEVDLKMLKNLKLKPASHNYQ